MAKNQRVPKRTAAAKSKSKPKPRSQRFPPPPKKKLNKPIAITRTPKAKPEPPPPLPWGELREALQIVGHGIGVDKINLLGPPQADSPEVQAQLRFEDVPFTLILDNGTLTLTKERHISATHDSPADVEIEDVRTYDPRKIRGMGAVRGWPLAEIVEDVMHEIAIFIIEAGMERLGEHMLAQMEKQILPTEGAPSAPPESAQ